MHLAPDTQVALRSVVNLINTGRNGGEQLRTVEDLDRFLTAEGFTGSREHSPSELESVRRLRRRLQELWTAREEQVVATINELLRSANALPQLIRHDDWDWHFHATTSDAPLAERMSTEAAMALADIIRGKAMDRMLVCAAADCDAVLLDLSRNRSKLYCSASCANRAHVAAYRARQAAG